ncbi:dipeptidase [Novosphingobium sp. M1R2S20]|uniref:Dipeptidase n=1 Tax=Novosphingobium rhizovicinum TaxID=3228928 RepID=A0ABV3RDL8_9SPHN
MRHVSLLAPLVVFALSGPATAATPEAVATAALKAAPVWDGHNDVPIQLRAREKNVIEGFDFTDTQGTADPATGAAAMHTDVARLREGQVGAQFWSVYVSAGLNDAQAVQATLEQIDVLKRLVADNPRHLQLATNAAEVEKATRAGRIASLIGMEGGHSIGGSLAVLRQMYDLGARYMTLTHSKNTAWADSSTDVPAHGGLNDMGRDVVREMQRIGMLVDLSHVSAETMHDALQVSRAPVIFSHSGARAINGHPRNVPDDVLARLKTNGGLIMVNFVPDFVSEESRRWSAAQKAESARLEALHVGNPAAAKAAMEAWMAAHPQPRATLAQVADHIDHIAKVAGVDHVGIGGDFDGISALPQGLEDVSTYPALFTELARRGYSQQGLEKIASRNMMRVLKAAEAYAAAHRGDPPLESPTTF